MSIIIYTVLDLGSGAGNDCFIARVKVAKTGNVIGIDFSPQMIEKAGKSAIRSVDFERIKMYWKLGERIFVEEQQEKERAKYGKYLIKNLSKEIEPEFGNGFSIRQLERARQFYRKYPITTALRSQFNWSQYKLMQIDNKD